MAEKQARWLRDYEVEQRSGGRITASWLRKDRVGKQIFPYHRVGRLCLYDMPEVDAVIEKSRFGGKAA